MSKVSERGQITIDYDVRKELDVRPGMIAYQRVVNAHLEIVFLPAPHHRSLFGALHRPGEPPLVVDSDSLEEAVMEAIAAEIEQDEHDD